VVAQTNSSARRYNETATSPEQFDKGLAIATEIMALARKLQQEGGLLWEIDAVRIQDLLDWTLELERRDPT
jgi:hypothetical protein